MFLEFFCWSRHPRDPRRSLADVALAWSGLLVFVAHQAYRAFLKWQLNNWYKTFYDLLGEGEGIDRSVGSGEDVHESFGNIFGELAHKRQQVWDELGRFALIVLPAVIVHPLASWFRNVWVLRWRVAMIESYISRWDVSKSPIEGASQRIHEDTSRFASGMHTCVATLLDALFTLAIFVPTLYGLDPTLSYVAVATAVGGVGVSAVVGRHLVGLEVNNQAAEAAFRRELVVLEVDPHLVDLSSNDTPLVAFHKLIRNLVDNYMALYRNFAALSAWLGTFDQAATILPYLLVAPRLFAEDPTDVLTLGALTQTANAFSKVFDSLNIVSDNWLGINEFRSVLRRLSQYEKAIDRNGVIAQRIPVVELVEAAEADVERHNVDAHWEEI